MTSPTRHQDGSSGGSEPNDTLTSRGPSPKNTELDPFQAAAEKREILKAIPAGFLTDESQRLGFAMLDALEAFLMGRWKK